MIKKILIDLGLVFVLSFASVFLAGVISMYRPDCYTCGATIALTVWAATILALQPVVWVSGLKPLIRVVLWSTAVLIGAGCYLLLEYVGASLLVSGHAVGIDLAFYANTVFVLVAGFGSGIGAIRLSHKTTYISGREPEIGSRDT